MDSLYSEVRKRAALAGVTLFLSSTGALAEEAQSGSPPSSSSTIAEEARAHFRAGVAHMKHPEGSQSAQAFQEFSRAYEISKSWKVLGNLGIAAMELERDGEAIEAFRQYLLGGGPDIAESEREVVENDLKTLERNVGWVTLRLVGGTAIVTDERRGSAGVKVTNQYGGLESQLHLGLRAGNHRITVPTEDGQILSWDFQLNPGDKLEKDLVLTSAAEPPAPAQEDVAQEPPQKRPVPTGVFVGLAVTGALAAGATTMGILTLNKKSSFDEVNDGSQETEAERLSSQVKTYGLVTDILLGATVASAGATAVLYFMRPSVKPVDTGLRFSPLVGPGVASLQFAGEF